MRFQYKNYKEETDIRDVVPLALEFHRNPGFGYKPGVFLRAYDNDRKAERTFRIDERFQPDPLTTNGEDVIVLADLTNEAIREGVDKLAARAVTFDEHHRSKLAT